MNLYLRVKELEEQIGKIELYKSPTLLTLFHVGEVVYMRKNGELIEWDKIKKSTDIVLIKNYLTKDEILR